MAPAGGVALQENGETEGQHEGDRGRSQNWEAPLRAAAGGVHLIQPIYSRSRTDRAVYLFVKRCCDSVFDKITHYFASNFISTLQHVRKNVNKTANMINQITVELQRYLV